jgi:hypothetical protein
LLSQYSWTFFIKLYFIIVKILIYIIIFQELGKGILCSCKAFLADYLLHQYFFLIIKYCKVNYQRAEHLWLWH